MATDRRWRLAALAVGVLLLPLLLWMSRDFGVTWDEIHRQSNGEKIWRLYHDVLNPPTTPAEHLQRPGRPGRQYGGLFDVVAVGLQRILPFDLYNVRHLLNATFGWLGIVCCGLLLLPAAGWRAATLGMVLLAVVPPYIGHSMNNPKDLPFAALAMAALAVIVRLPRGVPYLTVRQALALGVVIGLCLAVRPGGLLFVAYAGLWIATAMIVNREVRAGRIARAAAACALMVGVASIVPMPVWPYLWERPLIGVFQSAEGVTHYEWSGTVLFQGRDVSPDSLPWTYAPVWLVWTTPPVVLAGALLSLPAMMRPDGRRMLTAFLWFVVLFPVAYVIARGATLYDGIRHLLFVVPPLAAVAAVGWDHALRAWPQVRVAVVAALAIGLAEPVMFQLRNHPNQYVYFQPMVGGPAAVSTRFELDYWGNCLYQAMREAGNLGRAIGMPVTISGRQDRLLLLNAPRVPAVAVVPPRRGVHELELYLLRGRRADLRAFSTRGDVLWRVATHDGAALCAVVPGPQYGRLADAMAKAGITSLPVR